ncbi:hypothetical protein NONO_c16660 [Nocardia nova SH22a]|uniref:Uncharacterized protein n=1 Tax=Nocardia nova SH22a TaxID=1415166 RepID=W5TB92_9NOCA|nr:hypothetical protein [Nocardia nova]AHH16467.1 hypothetical protein NONO_c16660 [Nocardia nova SH22a]
MLGDSAAAEDCPSGEERTNHLAKEVDMSGSAAEQFDTHETKTNLSRIIERVEQAADDPS